MPIWTIRRFPVCWNAVSEHRHILFYDGHCGLCNWSVEFLIRHDRNGLLQFAPLQGETAVKLLPEELRLTISTVVYLRGNDSLLYERSGAVLRALIDSGSRMKYLAHIGLCVPRCIRDWCYNRVVHNRHRIFKSAKCDLTHAELIKQRMLR